MPKEVGEIAGAGAGTATGIRGEGLDEKHQVETNQSASESSGEEKRRFARISDNEHARKIWNFLCYTPERCRWDPEKPRKFSMRLNLLFGFGESCFFEKFPSAWVLRPTYLPTLPYRYLGVPSACLIRYCVTYSNDFRVGYQPRASCARARLGV